VRAANPFAPSDSYQTQAERAFVEEELDPFDFSLAEALGMTVETMRATISNREYLEWRAYSVWRNAQQELALKAAKAGRGR